MSDTGIEALKPCPFCGGPVMTSLTKLLPCPFCGSTNVDPEGWATLPEYAKTPEERSGPACDDCGASAESVERWNTRSGRLRVSDELDAATVERCARELEEFLEAESGAEYGMMSDFDRSALRARNRETQEYISAIRSLIPNSANEIHSSDGGVEGHPPQATGEAENAVVRQKAGIKPGPSEAIQSGYADYTPVTVRAHTVPNSANEIHSSTHSSIGLEQGNSTSKVSGSSPDASANTLDDAVSRVMNAVEAIVWFWDNQKIRTLSRAERNEQIEQSREELIDAFNAYATVAQSVESRTCSLRDAGSIPAGGTNSAGAAAKSHRGSPAGEGDPVVKQDCAPAGTGLTEEERQCIDAIQHYAGEYATPKTVLYLIAIIDRLTSSPVSEEELARIINPGAFDDDPIERHKYCSPLTVDFAQQIAREKARALLSRFDVRRKW